MKDKKLFTILTASYNSEKYIADWAKSILIQNYRPLEVIFVNDACTDKTGDIINDLSSEFKEKKIDLKIITNDVRKYCGSSYKKAWENSSGYFYGVVDSDDMLVKDAVEYIYGLYQEYPNVTWIYTQFDLCNEKMEKIRRGFCKSPSKKRESMLSLGMKGKHTYSHWRTFSDRHPKLEKIWQPGLRSSVDKFMGYRLEEFGIGMFVDKVCYKYRQGSKGAISHTEKAMRQWEVVKKTAMSRRKKFKIKPKKIIKYKK